MFFKTLGHFSVISF